MKIKASPCFWCGGPSFVRVKGPGYRTTEFNSCLPHEDHLIRHARMLFHMAYTYHDAQGKSRRYRWDSELESWTPTA